jgi:hypothetical protein
MYICCFLHCKSHVYPICDLSFCNPCIYMLRPPANHVWYEKFTPHVRPSSLLSLGQIHHLADFPFVEITNPPSTSADSLMLAPSCLHTLYMICNVTMTSLLYIQSLGVTIEAPPQVNIKLGFPCGCEAPTQAHKSHHQTHESPTQIQGGFHQTESVMWCP